MTRRWRPPPSPAWPAASRRSAGASAPRPARTTRPAPWPWSEEAVDSTKRPNCTIKFLTRAEAHSTLVFHIDLLFLQGAAAMDCGTPLHIRFSATDLCFFGARPRWPAAKRGLQAHRTRGGRSELGHQGLPGVSGSRASRPPEASASKASTLSWRSEERRVGKEGRSRWSPYH